MLEKFITDITGGVFKGVSEIISKFVTDPTKLAEMNVQLNQLAASTDVKLAELAVSDRASARQREMAVKDYTPSILSGCIVLIFGASQWYVFTHPLPVGSETLVARVLGTMDMALGLVLGYYFGSSASSEKKTEYLLKK